MFVPSFRHRGKFASERDLKLLAMVAITYLLQLLVNNPTLWAFIGIGATLWRIEQLNVNKKFKRIAIFSVGVLLILLIIVNSSQPSDAFMLSRAQEFFTTSFGSAAGGSTDYKNLIDLIFNSIRGVYIIFLCAAGINAWQDFRQQEEMSSFARIIFGSLVGVFSIDVISTFIIPTGGTPTT